MFIMRMRSRFYGDLSKSFWKKPRSRAQSPNRLNARQSKIFTRFPQKSFLKPRETIISLFRNVKRFQKLFWLRSWWDIFAWAYYEIAMTMTLKNFQLSLAGRVLQPESVTEFPLLSSYKRLESITCSFGNVKRFQNHFGYLVKEMSEPGLTINSLSYWNLKKFCPDCRARSQMD